MSKKGLIIIGSFLVVGIGVGAFFVVKAKKKKEELEAAKSEESDT